MTSPKNPEINLAWGRRALEHAQTITKLSFGRGSATRAEAQAAETVKVRLAELGIKDLRTQPFTGLRSLWFFLALAFGFAIFGHLAFWMLRIPMGTWPALLVSALAFGFSYYLLWRKFTFRPYPLGRYLPHGPSQNVIAALPPSGEVLRRVVLIGHLDSHRAVFWFAHDLTLIIFALLQPVALYGALAAPLLYALSVIVNLPLLGWLGVGLAALHFIAWLTGVIADTAPFSPGANDNASAIGSLLALAERLREDSLQNTEVWLAFTGCEESGCEGIQAFIAEYGEKLADALFLNFEMVGIGERLIYIQTEGMMRTTRIAKDVEEFVLEAGKDFDLRPAAARASGGFTEMGVLWENGLKGVCLLAAREDSPLPPEWHRLTDTADRLQPETLARVNELAWRILGRYDTQGLGG